MSLPYAEIDRYQENRDFLLAKSIAVCAVGQTGLLKLTSEICI